MARFRSITLLAGWLCLLVAALSGCSRAPSQPAHTTAGVPAGAVIAASTIVGRWQPVDAKGMDARRDAVLSIGRAGQWREFGCMLHYRMRGSGRVEVWLNGAHTIHMLWVQGDRLYDRTPSGAVRTYARVR